MAHTILATSQGHRSGGTQSRGGSFFALCYAAATWASAVLPLLTGLECVAVLLLMLFIGVVVAMDKRPDLQLDST